MAIKKSSNQDHNYVKNHRGNKNFIMGNNSPKRSANPKRSAHKFDESTKQANFMETKRSRVRSNNHRVAINSKLTTNKFDAPVKQANFMETKRSRSNLNNHRVVNNPKHTTNKFDAPVKQANFMETKRSRSNLNNHRVVNNPKHTTNKFDAPVKQANFMETKRSRSNLNNHHVVNNPKHTTNKFDAPVKQANFMETKRSRSNLNNHHVVNNPKHTTNKFDAPAKQANFMETKRSRVHSTNHHMAINPKRSVNPTRSTNKFDAPAKQSNYMEQNLEYKIDPHHWIYGINVIDLLLKHNPARFIKVFVNRSNIHSKIHTICQLAQSHGIAIEYVNSSETLDRLLSGETHHQGIAARITQTEFLHTIDLISIIANKPKHAVVFMVLDQIQDPRNLGACIRNAAAFGVDAVILSKHRSCGITATVRKVACGGVDLVPIAIVGNLTNCLKQLKQQGVWVGSLGANHPEVLTSLDLNIPLALVFGSEGHGIQQIIEHNSDFLINIPMENTLIDSLNLSVASGICLYEVFKQRQKFNNNIN